MKRILTLFTLVLQLNMLLIPQVYEVDQFDSNGAPVDDINSVIELFMVKLGYDKTPDDEDDDGQRSCAAASFINFTFHPGIVADNAILQHGGASANEKKDYALKPTPALLKHTIEVQTPPPDLFSNIS